MNHHEQFDELARQKLEQRAFPFEESAWLQAQEAMAAGKRRRPKAFWYFAGVTAIGLAVWGLWPKAFEKTAVIVQADSHAPVKEGGGLIETQAPEAARNLPSVPAEEQATAAIDTEANSQRRQMAASGSPDQRAEKDSQQQPPNRAVAGTQPIVQIADLTQVVPPVVKKEEHEIVPPFEALEADGRHAADVQDTVEPVVDIDVDLMASGVPQYGATEAGEGAAAVNPDAVVQPPIVEPKPAEDQLATDVISEVNSESQSAADPELKEPSSAAASSIDPPPADCASAATPEPSMVPLVSPRSPWEITALAGLFSTTSRYQGARAQDWSVTPERTASFGAEAMRMGRNFGYGIGLHYGTYADRLATPEESRTDALLSRYWFFQAVDTTVLIITGTTTDSLGNTVHTGVNVPTTVQVLRSAYDTSYTTSLIREARTRLNRTSYVEVPVLLDAHLVQGRWSIGVRGGPTIGLLTTRSGSLPGEGDGGYAELGAAEVRQFVFGWTARAYLRYRFNSAWSIGVEPSARGQFQDGVIGKAANRRSSGLGAVLTLSYRLR
ncbi:MAG: hypothetical protein IPM12_05955 [Flavobacteriales bacterium]|nr:hypothetical protein [Flavobacteriales bacterium]